MILVRFLDTSYEQPFESHLFFYLMKEHLDHDIELVTNLEQEVDIEFVSNKITMSNLSRLIFRIQAEKSYKKKLEYHKNFRLGFRSTYTTKAKNRVWFTGENLRAPNNIFDATFSFDPNDSVTKNVFVPFWFNRFFEVIENRENLKLSEEVDFFSVRTPLPRKIKAASFSSNYEVKRVQLIGVIEKIMPVEKFGTYHGKYVDSKFQASTDFGFQICNENDQYPNYVTEKLIDSWIARNVPIWSGIDDYNFFNKEAIIDTTGLNTSQVSELIRRISYDEMMYRQSQPLLLKEPSFTEAIAILKNLLE